MGDVFIPEPEPGRVGAKVHELVESGHEFYATAVTGQPSGRVRRPTLYLLAAGGIVMSLVLTAPVLLGVSLIAILLLALTDAVVEL